MAEEEQTPRLTDDTLGPSIHILCDPAQQTVSHTPLCPLPHHGAINDHTGLVRSESVMYRGQAGSRPDQNNGSNHSVRPFSENTGNSLSDNPASLGELPHHHPVFNPPLSGIPVPACLPCHRKYPPRGRPSPRSTPDIFLLSFG